MALILMVFIVSCHLIFQNLPHLLEGSFSHFLPSFFSSFPTWRRSTITRSSHMVTRSITSHGVRSMDTQLLGASAKCCVFFVFAHFIKVVHHTQCAIAIEVLPSRHGRWQHARNMASYIRIYNVMYDGILKATIMIWNFCFEQIMYNIHNIYSLKNGNEIHLARQIHTTCASPGKASGTDIGNMREIWQATLEYTMSCTMGSWRLRSWYEISVSNKLCMI